jgi:hypothetical protein
MSGKTEIAEAACFAELGLEFDPFHVSLTMILNASH